LNGHVICIVCQHAMHAECDVVMARPSICLSSLPWPTINKESSLL